MEGDPPEARWLVKVRLNSLRAIAADGTRLADNFQPSERICRRIVDAARLIAFGLPATKAAAKLGVKEGTLYKTIESHRPRFLREVDRAKAEGAPFPSTCAESYTRSDIPEWVRSGVRAATALIARGVTQPEVIRSLQLLPHTIEEWQARYPALWNEEMHSAMERSVSAVREAAGTPAFADDPDGCRRQARIAERWLKARGQALFDGKPEQKTLCSFFREYYCPLRLADASRKGLRRYEQILRVWALATGDPPIREITRIMLAEFRNHLTGVRGKPGQRLSTNSVRGYLRHLQSVLDLAGPPARGNRDGAGLLDQVPWIKPPRAEIHLPRIAPPEHLDACYRAAGGMDWPVVAGVEPAAWWRCLLVLVFNTGLRKRTVFELRWEHIDWQRCRIVIPACHMKSGRPLIAVLNTIAQRYLLSIRTDRVLVFPRSSDKTYYKAWHRLEKLAGIPASEYFGLQNIRKTNATALWENSPEAARLTLGHTTDRVTREFYIAGQGMIARALEALPQPGAFMEAMGGMTR